VFGVVVMDYSMTSEMTTLFLDLLCQAQLAHVIQEDHFDLSSMNLPYTGNLTMVFLSEVSNDFCRQLMGRCGRVSTTKNQGIGIVRCETPSGELLLPEPDKAIHSQNDVMPPIFDCSREQFQSDFDKLPSEFVDKLYRFLSSCKFAKEEFSVINHLLVLFQEVMYNQAFKYCCMDKNVDNIMTFLSCALIVLCGNHLQYYHVFVDARLRCLALNQNALETLVATTDTLEEIRCSFVQQIRNILPEEADLQSIFGMVRVMEEKTIKFCSMTDLAKMYLSLRRLLDLSHLLEKFLFNIRASKNSSHEVNGAVNGLLTMLRSLHDVLDQIMIIIMSFSIPCSTIESVKKMELFSQDEPVAAACSVSADPFVSMMMELRTELCTIGDVWSCLAKYERSQSPDCMLVIRDFRGIFSNAEQPQTSRDFLHGRIEIVLRYLKALTKKNAQTIECHKLEVDDAKKKIDENKRLHVKNVSMLPKANAGLVKTVKDSTTLIESLLQKNKEISEQIEQLKRQLSPYRSLNEKEAVTLFLRQLPQ
jgi:hypothetical protein